MTLLFSLTPYESRRLIARAVAARCDVRSAMERSYVIVAGGITNAYVVEELGGEIADKVRYSAGICTEGTLCVTPREQRIPPVVFHRGRPVDLPWKDALAERRPGTVFIKGANAVDPAGRAGVFLASETGGTIGHALGTVRAMGFTLIVPVGLEKLIPDVRAASRALGIGRTDLSFGAAVGMMPLMDAAVVTEVEALRTLVGVDAVPVGGGGIGGSEGQVVLVVSGEREAVARARSLVESIKGEPSLKGLRRSCVGCTYRCVHRE